MKYYSNFNRYLLFISILIITFGCTKEEIGKPNVSEIVTNKDSIVKNLGKISNLFCDDVNLIGQVLVNQQVENTELHLKYSGGNGYDYSTLEISSTSVNGLKLILPSGYFSTQRSGILKFKVTGIATTIGTANFPIVIGGQSGILKIIVIDGNKPTSGYGPNFKDIEGTIYKSVYIGNQLWQAENLQTTKFNDGTPIPIVESQSNWFKNFSNSTTIPMACFYNNDFSSKQQNGTLYNWYVIDSLSNGHLNICPQGWHVPTDNDWKILEEYLGGKERAGGKMKEVGSFNWVNPNTSATNESLFSALPSGYRFYNGHYTYKGNYGFYWSSTENGKSNAYFRYLYNESARIIKNSIYKSNGFSIRCIKD